MGNVLYINGADFSSVSVWKITPIDRKEVIDTDTLTVYKCSLGSAEVGWFRVTSGEGSDSAHVLVEVNEGEVYYATLYSKSGLTTSGTHYGFLTASHTEPVNNKDKIKYVSGTDRVAVRLQEGGTAEITIPTGTKYLALNVIDGASTKWRWELIKK